MSAAPRMTMPDRKDGDITPLRPELERGKRLTQLGNAERFAIRHGDRVRYCPQFGAWLVNDGRRWAIDSTAEVERLAKDTIVSQYTELATLKYEERAAVVRHIMASERKPAIDGMLALAKSEPGMILQADKLDANPRLLNVLNGTIETDTGRLREHRPSDFITKLAPVEYDPDAQCPRWVAFVSEIMAGDLERVAFLQTALGYALTGLTVEQVVFLLYGTGANGKSTLLEVIRRILDDYAKAADFSTFLEHKGDGPRNDVARLVGARFVTTSEAGDGRRLNESLIKTMTGGEPLTARFLHHEYFEFAPAFKLFLATNHKPTIRGTDEGIWRRIRLIPFTVQIPPERRDKHLVDTLMAEAPGILAWLVDGCVEWHGSGLPASKAVQAATADYRADMDKLGAYLADCCELEPHAITEAAPLYASYRHWCERSGEHTLSQTAFGRALTERGIAPDKHGRTVRRIGIRLVVPGSSATVATVRDSTTGFLS